MLAVESGRVLRKTLEVQSRASEQIGKLGQDQKIKKLATQL
jgi:hypothetical protein